MIGTNVPDVTLGDIDEEEVFELDDMEVEPGEMDKGDEMRNMMGGMRNFLDKASNAFEAMAATAKTRKRGRSRRSEEEEEEEVKSQPRLVSIKNHLLEDDAHTIIDWKARFLIRPYNGGDQKLYWSKKPRKEVPVLEDLDVHHLTKAPINPSVIAKTHDRGALTTGKQWLSSNYSVEEKGGKWKALDDKGAGAFLFNYEEAKGVWEVVDAIHNYMMVLGQVRPDDWSGKLLLGVLHRCRMFAHPKFSDKIQRDLIMELFDQVREVYLSAEWLDL